MAIVIVVILVVILLVIGVFKIRQDMKRLREKVAFAKQYHEKLRDFVLQNGFDQPLYTWLVYHSEAMQTQLGPYGVRTYIPTGSSTAIPNYLVLLNSLPALRESRTTTFPRITPDPFFRDTANTCLETMVRYLGAMESVEDNIQSDLKNPLIWLREGVRVVVLIPLRFLQWVGLLNKPTYIKWSGSGCIKVIAGLGTIATLLSTIITIVLKWEDFVETIKQLF
jgi:hypothetical protein